MLANTDYDFFGPKIGLDIFRFEDGLIGRRLWIQNPSAPSPTAIIGARIPRRLRSRSRSPQESVDSR